MEANSDNPFYTPQWDKAHKYRLLVHMPAEHERRCGAEDDSAQKEQLGLTAERSGKSEIEMEYSLILCLLFGRCEEELQQNGQHKERCQGEGNERADAGQHNVLHLLHESRCS